MILTIMMAIIIGVACGVVMEKCRWVRAVKDNKVIAVDGDLYKVIKTGENAG